MHCIMLTIAHIQPFYALDQVPVEPESEVQAEQAQVEEFTNLSLEQGKPRCIPPHSLAFIYYESLYLCYV
jgi:hypothetical protein